MFIRFMALILLLNFVGISDTKPFEPLFNIDSRGAKSFIRPSHGMQLSDPSVRHLYYQTITGKAGRHQLMATLPYRWFRSGISWLQATSSIGELPAVKTKAPSIHLSVWPQIPYLGSLGGGFSVHWYDGEAADS